MSIPTAESLNDGSASNTAHESVASQIVLEAALRIWGAEKVRCGVCHPTAFPTIGSLGKRGSGRES